jgi:hypothetical protein
VAEPKRWRSDGYKERKKAKKKAKKDKLV